MGVGLCLAESWVLLDCPTPTPPLKGRGYESHNAVAKVIAPSTTPGAFASATGQSRCGLSSP